MIETSDLSSAHSGHGRALPDRAMRGNMGPTKFGSKSDAVAGVIFCRKSSEK
jgi:hypothetical protein